MIIHDTELVWSRQVKHRWAFLLVFTILSAYYKYLPPSVDNINAMWIVCSVCEQNVDRPIITLFHWWREMSLCILVLYDHGLLKTDFHLLGWPIVISEWDSEIILHIKTIKRGRADMQTWYEINNISNRGVHVERLLCCDYFDWHN